MYSVNYSIRDSVATLFSFQDFWMNRYLTKFAYQNARTQAPPLGTRLPECYNS